jgi:hypothetical protein
MQTSHASTILRRAWNLYDGGDFDDPAEAPGSTEFRRMTVAFAARLRDAWDAARWPDLCPTERRHFREWWSITGPVLAANGIDYILDNFGELVMADRYYDAEAQVVFKEAGSTDVRYYQSLRDSNFNNPPSISGLTNLDYWADLETSYAADDWAASTSYAVGDRVRNQEDDEYYQCHTAHTSGSDIDLANWGRLTPFRKYIEHNQFAKNRIGTFLDIWENDPEVKRGTRRVPFWLGPDRANISRNLLSVHVKYRTPCPDLSHARLLTGSTELELGQYAYWTNTTSLVGNFYKAVFDTVAGENPATFNEKFRSVSIPRYFEDFIVHGIVAELKEGDRESDGGQLSAMQRQSALNDDLWMHLAIPTEHHETEIYTR